MTDKSVKSIIVVNKPHSITSMDVVRVLRRILKPLSIERVGYAGTLDPYATGVLVVGIGRKGTKQLGELSDQDKEYICEIDLMKDTYSGDMQHFKPEYQKTVNELPDNFEVPTIEKVSDVVKTFVREITQIPPTTSAIKINGKKACDLVRKGIDVVMKERTVTIYEIEILTYEFPVLKLRVKCSKGTYIRSLARDIGKALGLWGSLLSLVRTESGKHKLKDALELNKITLDDLIDDMSEISSDDISDSMTDDKQV